MYVVDWTGAQLWLALLAAHQFVQHVSPHHCVVIVYNYSRKRPSSRMGSPPPFFFSLFFFECATLSAQHRGRNTRSLVSLRRQFQTMLSTKRTRTDNSRCHPKGLQLRPQATRLLLLLLPSRVSVRPQCPSTRTYEIPAALLLPRRRASASMACTSSWRGVECWTCLTAKPDGSRIP